MTARCRGALGLPGPRIPSPQVSDTQVNRRGGRYAVTFRDDELYDVVRKVLQANDIKPSEEVSTRRFNKLRPKDADRHVPSAKQIATRLKRSWPEVVAIVRADEDGKAAHHAETGKSRSPARIEIDERHMLFTLRRVARLLGETTVTPVDFEDARAQLLRQADRDQNRELMEELLLTYIQIVRVAGDWDIALRACGLNARPGVVIDAEGLAYAKAVRDTAGIEDLGQDPVDDGDAGGKRRVKPTPRDRPALSTLDATLAFLHTKGAWPSGAGALRAWAKLNGVALSKVSGEDVRMACDQARDRLLSEGKQGPPEGRTVAAGGLREGAALPEGLPPAEVWQHDLDKLIGDMVRFLTEHEGKPTQASYRNWAKANGASAPSSFNRPGRPGFAGMVRLARERMASTPNEGSEPLRTPTLADAP